MRARARMALQWPILVTASASAVAAACFVGVARALRRRRYSPELRFAGQAYVLWWAMFALQAATDSLRALMGVAGSVPVEPYIWLARIKIAAAGVGIWALGRYVLYLWNGRQWFSLPLAAFAATHAAFFLYGLERSLPAHITIDTWSPRPVFEGPGLAGTDLGPFTLFFFFLPPIVLSLAYLLLIRRLETRTQRFRVVSIAIAILVFQAVGAIQFNPKTPASSPLFAILPLVNAGMALLVLATYAAPAWLAKGLRIEGLPPKPTPATAKVGPRQGL